MSVTLCTNPLTCGGQKPPRLESQWNSFEYLSRGVETLDLTLERILRCSQATIHTNAEPLRIRQPRNGYAPCRSCSPKVRNGHKIFAHAYCAFKIWLSLEGVALAGALGIVSSPTSSRLSEAAGFAVGSALCFCTAGCKTASNSDECCIASDIIRSTITIASTSSPPDCRVHNYQRR